MRRENGFDREALGDFVKVTQFGKRPPFVQRKKAPGLLVAIQHGFILIGRGGISAYAHGLGATGQIDDRSGP